MIENKNSGNAIEPPLWLSIVVVIFAASLISGMFVSRALMSIGMIGLCLPFFTHRFAENIAFAKKSLLFWSSLSLMLVLACTFPYSEDLKYYTHRMEIKATLLLFPLAWAGMRNFPSKIFAIVLYLLILMVSLESIGALGNYALHFTKITKAYRAGKVIPLPFKFNHIRFSLMLAGTIFLSYFFWKEKVKIWNLKAERWFLGIAFALNLIFLHLLSVRSGLLAFYAALGLYIVYDTFLHRKYMRGALLLGALTLIPILLYFTVPTIHHKIDYTIRDVSRYLNGESAYHYSDGNRLTSLDLAWQLGKKSPWTGVGLGDVANEMFAMYASHHPELPVDQWLIPHNQFVYCWLAGGVPALAALLFLVIAPYTIKSLRSALVPLLIHTIYMTSFLSEATLENQLGSISYGFLFWWCVSYYSSAEKKISS